MHDYSRDIMLATAQEQTDLRVGLPKHKSRQTKPDGLWGAAPDDLLKPESLEMGGPWWLVKTESLERGGPWVLKLRQKNGDSKCANERGPSLVCLLGSSCQYKRFLHCLGCSDQRSTKYFFFLNVHNSISIHLSPSPCSKLGRHSCKSLVETETNGGLKDHIWKGPSLVGSNYNNFSYNLKTWARQLKG